MTFPYEWIEELTVCSGTSKSIYSQFIPLLKYIYVYQNVDFGTKPMQRKYCEIQVLLAPARFPGWVAVKTQTAVVNT